MLGEARERERVHVNSSVGTSRQLCSEHLEPFRESLLRIKAKMLQRGHPYSNHALSTRAGTKEPRELRLELASGDAPRLAATSRSSSLLHGEPSMSYDFTLVA